MPRKQRFKPSRKPQQNNQSTVSSSQADNRKDIGPDVQDIEKAAPDRQQMPDIEGDRY